MKRVIRLILPFQAFLLSVLLVSAMVKAEETSQEYQVKTAFMVNFSRFISWPEEAFTDAKQNFSFCFIGKDVFGSALSGLEDKSINGRRISLAHIASFQLASSCHMLYVEASEEKNFRANAAALARLPVVTVSDITGFADIGGGIEFVPQSKKLSFIINRTALKQSGIEVRASLLDLAVSVK